MGTMADKNGRYIISNIPAGLYDVSAQFMGYSKITKKNVKVSVDLNTEINFEISAKVLPLEEVVVTEKRQLIHSDITSSSYFISGQEINEKLPVSSYRQAIALLPGVIGTHIRGGRENEVVYMLDGLPLQGGLARELASNFPNSSIVEMMVQTGGFAAEYGNASSGIVNVVSQNGSNKIDGAFKVYTDFIETGITGNDNTRRAEFYVGGPLTIGFGGPLINANYFFSADLNLSDTAHRDQMRQAFGFPVFQNYNINSKLSFNISSNTILSFQGLLSNWKWRQFHPQWQLNIDGLAENKHISHRISASLTHTFSPKLFTSLRVANYRYQRSILGDETPEIEFANPTDPNSQIISGNQPWHEVTTENIVIIKLDAIGQLSTHHQIKSGLELQNHNVTSNSVRYDYFSSKEGSIVFNKTENDYDFSPQNFALYLQDQISLNGINANIGFRYDIFSPKARVTQILDEFQELRQQLGVPRSATRSQNKTSFSPRIGVSIPLSDNERLHVNYGWYYQLPSLFYYYTGNNYALNGYLPIIGNVDLEPIKTISSEFSYKRVVGEDWLFVLSGFTKQFNNLVDTQTFILPDSVLTSDAQTVGFSRYTSTATGRTSGFEVTLQKRISPQISGRISYTYMKAKGTTSTAEEEFNLALTGTLPREKVTFPLSWDQRHTFILDLDYENRLFHINALYRLLSPLPFTTPGSATPNNSRLSWRNLLDLKVKLKTYTVHGARLNPFFEIRNLFDEENVIDEINNTGVRAYRLFDPINNDFGRRLRMGVALDF